MYYLRVLSALCLSLAMLCLPLTAAALDGVTVVLSEEGGAYAQVADKLRAVLSRNGGTVSLPVKVISLMEGASLRAEQGQVLVAVGTEAMDELAKKKLPQPILNVLVPRAAFEKTARQSGRLGDPRNFSAIYLDQPWARQFALIRHALPGRIKVGIMLAPNSSELATALSAAAKAAGFVAITETVDGEADLLPSLKRLLGECDVLLSVPDPLIYNRNTVQSILLTSYRHQVPLIGFSPSYVKAGAIAAVFSVPEQIGQQAAEVIQRLAADRRLSLPQPPRYFSVGVNAQVARSLGISLDDEASLNNKLKGASEGEP
ncbi:ABC transporter substrate-binding protein [Sulfuricella denitrificans skB26]|uniref:ABC transporter substrate-binding protein n=1 Tax=Sulfuricella denitrificans (strain DSM 22764 / NBRC 105220 / skB26) TaxID=1163617 RepID=S6B5S5_SULDS|nr:ABC transporter substrate binding protein [Sulfuricella denitrificans]BAN35887.1 ABC transporter substrate-binding protein [Sulfuricella denitrificans skB26]